MSRITDLTSVVYSGRHCHDINCRKCHARSRWMRRKAWRARKTRTAATTAGRGDAR